MTRKTTTAVITRALELVEGGWTKGASARNRFFKSVNVKDAEACYWSIDGAIWRAVSDTVDSIWEHEREREEGAAAVCRAAFNGCGLEIPLLTLSEWNDSMIRTQEHVVEVLRETLAI